MADGAGQEAGGNPTMQYRRASSLALEVAFLGASGPTSRREGLDVSQAASSFAIPSPQSPEKGRQSWRCSGGELLACVTQGQTKYTPIQRDNRLVATKNPLLPSSISSVPPPVSQPDFYSQPALQNSPYPSTTPTMPPRALPPQDQAAQR